MTNVAEVVQGVLNTFNGSAAFQKAVGGYTYTVEEIDGGQWGIIAHAENGFRSVDAQADGPKEALDAAIKYAPFFAEGINAI